MKTSHRLFLIFTVCATVALVLVYRAQYAKPMAISHTENMKSVETIATSPIDTISNTAEATKESENAENIDELLALDLKKHFGATIHNGHSQIKALEKLIDFLKRQYPDSWELELEHYLRFIFPDHADSMLQLNAALNSYNHWLQNERLSLQSLTPQERNQLIWQMRDTFFGDDAKEIWAEAYKSYQVAQTLLQLSDPANSMTTAQQTNAYVTTLATVYGEDLPRELEKRQQELTDHFLGLEAVQNNLRALPREDRQEQLNTIRRKLGMGEDAIKRWAQLDQSRDTRRENGAAYMQERLQLQQSLTAEEFSTALSTLQQHYFGSEADIIQSEEASGYFRFNDAPIFGKN